MVDLLCSEYGWTKDYVLDHVTPGQAELLGRMIGARRRAEMARQLMLLRVAMWGSAQQVAALERELAAGDEDAEDGALAAMGIAIQQRRGGGPGCDDGQPAG